MKITVVVPAHNEAPRIGAVLAAINGSPAVGNVIVVADDCTDRTEAIGMSYQGIVVRINARTKGTAMAAGLRYVEGDHVLFVDADLSGLQPAHVTALSTLPPMAGMLVGVRGDVPRPLAYLPSVSGERRLPVNFARALRLAGSGWRTETMINAAVAKARLPHSQIVLRGVSNPTKIGPVKTPKEWTSVALASVAAAPELIRYVATETWFRK